MILLLAISSPAISCLDNALRGVTNPLQVRPTLFLSFRLGDCVLLQYHFCELYQI